MSTEQKNTAANQEIDVEQIDDVSGGNPLVGALLGGAVTLAIGLGKEVWKSGREAARHRRR